LSLGREGVEGRVIYRRRGKRQRWGGFHRLALRVKKEKESGSFVNGPRFLTVISIFHPHPPLSDVI